MSVRDTPEGFLQVAYAGPSSGYDPPMIQLTIRVGHAVVQGYLTVEDAAWLGADIAAVVDEVRVQFAPRAP